MLRSAAIALAVSSLAVLPSAAQMMGGCHDTTTGPPKAATSFGLGVQALDVSEFNAALKANGFPTIGSAALISGISTEIRFGHWDLSFSGAAIRGGDNRSSSWVTQTRGSALMIGAGYAVVDGPRWRVVPNIGAGWARIDYHIEQRRGGMVDSVLVDPLRGTDLNGQTAIWHTGIAVSYRLSSKPRNKIALAARVGYAMALGETSWKVDKNDLSSGPRAAYGGLYARLGLSFGMPKRSRAIVPALVSIIPWLRR